MSNKMSCILRGVISGPRLGTYKSILKRKTQIYLGKNIYRWYSPRAMPALEKGPLFIAAEAAVGFCRTALVTEKGKIIKITVERAKSYHFGIFHEMSSNSTWKAMLLCIKRLVENVDKNDIKGIGFISTSALVCLDEKGDPVTASVSRDPNINCITYYDQRSILEVEKINKTRHARLQYFGDKVSPEFQESKMMWLKNNLKEDCWDKVGHFMELSDFLTWKATGSLVRSSSGLLSKWSYEVTINGNEGWNAGFFEEIGMPEIAKDQFSKIGSTVQRPGVPVAKGLLENVAKEIGLRSGLPVATSMSNALAGGLGIIGCQIDEFDIDYSTRLCIVFGTRASSHFLVSHDPVFVKGVWGPFKDGILPGMWLHQAGQTTAESVMDYVISRHPTVPQIKKHLGNMHIYKYLNKILRLKQHKYKLPGRSFLTKDLHILPDFGGNLSPLADPRIRGMISGLSLLSNQESLALLYLATMQSLAYSTRHIISAITQHGLKIKSIIVGGDLGKNSLFMYLHKDVCQLPTISPYEFRCKLVGAAILGAIASDHFHNFSEAIQSMSSKGTVLWPDKFQELREYHNKKYQVFLKLYEHQLEYRRIMSSNDEVKRTQTVHK